MWCVSAASWSSALIFSVLSSILIRPFGVRPQPYLSATPTTGGGSTMSDSRWDRWGPIAGIAFVVLLVVGISLAISDLPAGDDPVSKFTSFYNDKGDRAKVIIGSYLMVLSGVFFLW